MSEELSLPQRAVLLVLMAEARPLTNAELRDLAGVTLTGKPRQELNRLKLVDSVKVGRSFRHELTDGGWVWCRLELLAATPAKSGSAGGALYAVLAGLARYLDRADLALADLFHPNAEAQIRAAYDEVVDRPGDWVGLARLRRALEDLPRQAVDSTLRRMAGTTGVNLAAESNQKALSAIDREAALRLGGESIHLLAIQSG